MDEIPPQRRNATSALSIGEIGSRVRDDLALLRDAAERRRDELVERASDFVGRHPVAAVGAAFGVGFLLSGAIFSSATGRLVRLGARFYFGQLVRGGLASSGLNFFGLNDPKLSA